MHAALIRLARFIICHTDAAKRRFTNQPRSLLLESRLCSGAPTTVIHGKRDAYIWRMNHVFGRNTHITKKPQTFDLKLQLIHIYLIIKQSFCSCCSYFTPNTSNVAWIHRYTPPPPPTQWYLLFTAAFLHIHCVLKALRSSNLDFLNGIHGVFAFLVCCRNFILKCSHPDQVCDETSSLSHCPVSPHTTGIITDFAEHWCHQSSKPTSQTSLY